MIDGPRRDLLVILDHVRPEDLLAGADGFDEDDEDCYGEHPPRCAGLTSPFDH